MDYVLELEETRMNFQGIIGHEKIIKHLQSAMQMNKTSHAYIFNGEDGSGKNAMADAFVTALQCMEEGIDSCGKCKSCISAASRNHPDIIRVTHEKSVISVEDIRLQLNNDIYIKPYSGKYKIYIIDEAEKMNAQAQNALLKTIEEPPPYAKIILLTNNSQTFLPTILSRCILLDLKPISKELIKDYLILEYKIPDYIAELSAVFSGGILGRAVRYACSEEFISMKDEIVRLLSRVHEIKHQDITDAVKYFNTQKKNIDECIMLMLMWFHDVLMFKACANANYISFKDEIEYIRKQASLFSFQGIQNILDEIERLKKRLKANVNFDVSIELLFIEIQNNQH